MSVISYKAKSEQLAKVETLTKPVSTDDESTVPANNRGVQTESDPETSGVVKLTIPADKAKAETGGAVKLTASAHSKAKSNGAPQVNTGRHCSDANT